MKQVVVDRAYHLCRCPTKTLCANCYWLLDQWQRLYVESSEIHGPDWPSYRE